MATRSAQAPSSTVRRTRLFWAPILVFLTAQVLGPLIGEFAAWPFVRPDDYAFNQRALEFGTMTAALLATIGVTWGMTRFEGTPRSLALGHLRQSSLVYAYALVQIGSQLQDALRDVQFACYTCPIPWYWIVPAGLLGNLVGISLVRPSKVAA